MSRSRRITISLLAVLAASSLGLLVSACGYESHHKDVVEGEPVELGELSFNVIFSRYLNPNDNEDVAYLVGKEPPTDGNSYFGVFLQVQNESEEVQYLPETLYITDAYEERFDVVPSESLYALPLGGEVESQEQIPVLDSTADLGAIEGSLAVFLLPEAANENRPLTLHIPGPDGEDGTVTLDL